MKIAVVGSGICGLTASCLLQKQGHEVVVYEASDRPGGRIYTEKFGEGTLEWGPHTLLSSHECFEELLELSGKKEEVCFADDTAKKRYIWQSGSAQALPQGLMPALTSPLLGPLALLRVLCEPFVTTSKENLSVYDFFSRRFGKKIADNFVDPFVSGIYSGDSHLLSSEHAFPRIVSLEKKYGSVIKGFIKERKNKAKRKMRLVSFEGGMATLIEGLISELNSAIQIKKKLTDYSEHDNKVKLSFQDGDSVEYDKVVLAMRPKGVSTLLSKKSVSLSSALVQLPTPPIAVVHVRGTKLTTQLKEKGFGLLFGSKNPLGQALGVLFVSDFFPRSDNQSHFCVYLGGRRFPEVGSWDAKKIEENALETLRKSLKLKGDPVEVKSQLIYPGLAQYEKNLYLINMLKCRYHQESPNIRLVGTWSGGISVLDGFKNVKEMLKDWA